MKNILLLTLNLLVLNLGFGQKLAVPYYSNGIKNIAIKSNGF
ncbi:hypothetical protein [Emticicia oligotrophica]|nr:hypothetical protein [Emticicia oligotrophica]